MTEHYEVLWQSSAPLGASSQGYIGKFSTAASAVEETCRLNSETVNPECPSEGIVTSYVPVLVCVDEYGNREIFDIPK